MLAVEKGHLEVVKAMMKEDPGLMSLSNGSGTTVIHWALEEGHHRSAFFVVRCVMFVALNFSGTSVIGHQCSIAENFPSSN